jgi:hypothetical protein
LGFFYNASFSSVTTPQEVCQRICSSFDRTLSQSTVDVLACNCNPGYFFATSGTVGCTLNCTAETYSIDVNKNSTTCVCYNDYFFVSITGQCIADSNHSHAVAVAVRIAIPLGVLALIALALILWFALTPAAAVAPSVMTMPVSQLAPQVIKQSASSAEFILTSRLAVTQPVVGFGGILR